MQPTRTKSIFRYLTRNAMQRNSWTGFVAYFDLSPDLQGELPALHLSLLVTEDHGDESLKWLIDQRTLLSELYNSLPD